MFMVVSLLIVTTYAFTVTDIVLVVALPGAGLKAMCTLTLSLRLCVLCRMLRSVAVRPTVSL